MPGFQPLSHRYMISAFVFATRIVQFLFYLNPEFQASHFGDCTGQFVSDLVENPEDLFSLFGAQLALSIKMVTKPLQSNHMHS